MERKLLLLDHLLSIMSYSWSASMSADLFKDRYHAASKAYMQVAHCPRFEYLNFRMRLEMYLSLHLHLAFEGYVDAGYSSKYFKEEITDKSRGHQRSHEH